MGRFVLVPASTFSEMWTSGAVRGGADIKDKPALGFAS